MNPGDFSINGSFLEHRGRKLFYLLLEPVAASAQGSILFLPPFAEEMNKSRHIVASQAREFAAAGHRVMLLDVTGCGDAGGDFSDASWQVWLEDALFAADKLVAMGAVPLNLWGLRLGALLACEVSRLRSDVQQLLLWQPVLNGEQQIDQFLRLKTMVSAVNGTVSFDRKTLWSELRAGRSLEVAGYDLSSAMALELAKVRLNDLNPVCQQVHWLEISALSGDTFPVAAQSVISHWQQQGVNVGKRSIAGDPFWRTVDAGINASLQQCSSDVLALQ
tara:strand:+ start:12916 stop:13743 length:828 start_codon:yes stop_codon:yes gene_type:complete